MAPFIRTMTLGLALTFAPVTAQAQEALVQEIEGLVHCASLVSAGRAISRYMTANDPASNIPQDYAALVPEEGIGLALQLRAWELAGCDDPVVDVPDLAVEMMMATSSSVVDAMALEDTAAVAAHWNTIAPQLSCTAVLSEEDLYTAQQMIAENAEPVCGYRAP